MLITVTIIQGAIAYGQLWLLLGSPLPLLPYLTAMAITFLALIFYLAFAMMLGTLFNGRGPGVGISLLFVFGYSVFYQLIPFLGRIMPWNLTSALGPAQPPLAVYAPMGQPIPDILPLISTAALTILFLVVALWRFHKEEF